MLDSAIFVFQLLQFLPFLPQYSEESVHGGNCENINWRRPNGIRFGREQPALFPPARGSDTAMNPDRCEVSYIITEPESVS